MVLDHWSERHKKGKDLRENIEVNTFSGLPVVYIAEYTTHDDYGPLRETDVFSEEIDAWAFVLKQRNEGATDISVKPRLVYLDADRTVNFDD